MEVEVRFQSSIAARAVRNTVVREEAAKRQLELVEEPAERRYGEAAPLQHRARRRPSALAVVDECPVPVARHRVASDPPIASASDASSFRSTSPGASPSPMSRAATRRRALVARKRELEIVEAAEPELLTCTNDLRRLVWAIPALPVIAALPAAPVVTATRATLRARRRALHTVRPRPSIAARRSRVAVRFAARA